MRKLKALFWLHLLRTRRYLVSILSGSFTDALWMAIFLFGAFSSRDILYAKEAYWALVAWAIIANAGWMIGGWIDYLSELGLLEPLDLAGSPPVTVASARAFTVLFSVFLSSCMLLLLSFTLGLNPLEVSSPLGLMVSLSLLWIQATAYGSIIASTVILTTTPGVLLDIASLLYMGLLLVDFPVDMLSLLSLIPLLGPGYLARQSVNSTYGLNFIPQAVTTTALLVILATRYSRYVVEAIKRREGYKSIAFQ